MKQLWRIKIEYFGEQVYDLYADSKDEAERIAKDCFDDEHPEEIIYINAEKFEET